MKSRGDALRDYVIRRLLLMVPTFLGITLVTFTLLQFVPGGQIDQIRMQLAGAGGGVKSGVGAGPSRNSTSPRSSWRSSPSITGSTSHSR